MTTAERNILDEDVDLDPQHLAVGKIAAAFALVLGLFHFWTGYSGGLPLLQQRSVHVGLVMIVLWLVLLHQSARRRNPFVIGATMAIIAITTAFMTMVYLTDDEILTRLTMAPTWQLVFGGVVILICLEASRRVMGWVLPVIVLISAGVVLVADKVDWLRQYIISVKPNDLLNTMAFSTNGLFGSITGTSAGVVASFLVLGSFLTASGGSQSFLNLARFLVGRFRGGPAKVSLLTSALFGTVSGSAVANVVVDGVFNIPLMKRSGYRPTFAAAVEAAASTGGQIVPPVMGAAAFIMAEFLGISYSTVLIAAIVPAALYYLGLGITCHVEALKLGLPKLPKNQLPRARTLITMEFIGSFAAPITVLMVTLYYFNRSLLFASWAATVTVMLYMLLGMKATLKERLLKIVRAFILSGIEIARIGAIVVAAQLMVTVMGISGMGPRIANELAGRDLSLPLTLLVLGIVVILIGFPLPTAPAYILAASVANPLFAEIGVNMLAGHMFLLYFAVYGNVTPPVMPSVYPAAAIARCDSMAAGWEATRLLAPALLVPFAFVLEPGMLITESSSASGVALELVRMAIGIIFVSCGLAFWCLRPLSRWSGILLAVSGALIAWPTAVATTVGLIGAVVALIPVILMRRAAATASGPAPGVLQAGDPASEVRGEAWEHDVGRARSVFASRGIRDDSSVAFGPLTTTQSIAAVLAARGAGARVLLLPSSANGAGPELLVGLQPSLALTDDELASAWTAQGLATASWTNLKDRMLASAPDRNPPAKASSTLALLGNDHGDPRAILRVESGAHRKDRRAALAGAVGITASDRLLLPASLDGWWADAFAEAALEVDGLVIVEPRATFDPAQWLAAAASVEASSAVLSNDMLRQVVAYATEHGQRPPELLSAVIHGGAEPCDEALKLAAIDLFGPILIEWCGGADLAATVILCEDWLEDHTNLGHPYSDDIRVLVLDPEGDTVDGGATGRIAYAWDAVGVTVTEILANGEERTIDTGQPRLTGLIGFVDDDYRLHVTDRAPIRREMTSV